MLLCFAGGTVSPMMRLADGRQKDDKKKWGGRNTSKDDGRDRAPNDKVDYNDVAGLFACYFVVIRCDRMIYRDISCYDNPISCDVTIYDTVTILPILSYRGKRSIDYVPNPR